MGDYGGYSYKQTQESLPADYSCPWRFFAHGTKTEYLKTDNSFALRTHIFECDRQEQNAATVWFRYSISNVSSAKVAVLLLVVHCIITVYIYIFIYIYIKYLNPLVRKMSLWNLESTLSTGSFGLSFVPPVTLAPSTRLFAFFADSFSPRCTCIARTVSLFLGSLLSTTYAQ
jgi:hypothetical protein